jgi:hypothetical protein
MQSNPWAHPNVKCAGPCGLRSNAPVTSFAGEGGIMKALSNWNTCRIVAVLALLLPLSSFAAAPPPDSATITNLLDQARAHAALADDDAVTLESYTRSPLSWQSHAARLTIIKEHVNNLIKDVNQLSSMRAEGSPWQQEAIDRVDPLLKEIADHLTTTIQHLNENQGQIQMQAFRDYVKVNSNLISKAHNMIADYVDYGQAKAKADALEQEHSLPPDREGE